MKTQLIKGRICTRKHRVTMAKAASQGLKGTARAYARRAVAAAGSKDRQTCRHWLTKLATYARKNSLRGRSSDFVFCVVSELTC